MGALEGKVALVTGGSSGIGREIAVRYGAEGAKVVLAARREKEGNETAEMIKSAGGDATFVQGDITNMRDIENMVATTESVCSNRKPSQVSVFGSIAALRWKLSAMPVSLTRSRNSVQ